MDNQKLSDRTALGWKFLLNSRKWHYFGSDGRSLCGRWLTLGGAGEFGANESPDNCAKCSRLVIAKEEANEAI